MFVQWLLNLAYGLTAWLLFGVVTVAAWYFIDKYIFPKLDFSAEIDGNNISAATVVAALIGGWFIGGALVLGQVLG